MCDVKSHQLLSHLERGSETRCSFNGTYNKLPEVNQAAIVENKRLRHVLQIAQLAQQKSDNRWQ